VIRSSLTGGMMPSAGLDRRLAVGETRAAGPAHPEAKQRPTEREGAGVSFSEAIQDAFSKYARFSGRSSRPAYWWFALFQVLVLLAAAIVDAALKTWVFYALTVLALFLPSLAVGVRRLHDVGRTGWWLLIGLIPLIGTIVLIVFTVQASDPPNEWGNGPDERAAEAPLTA
jgi:uncharacterized membrane protein YhaH (DUF805 family)